MKYINQYPFLDNPAVLSQSDATAFSNTMQSNRRPPFVRWLLGLVLLLSVGAHAQISVLGGSGLAATYTSLTNAGGLFSDINNTAQTGNVIVISITGDITLELGTNSLNAGAWTSISISPSGGTTRTISGTASGIPLINLNGADNVTINGLNTAGDALIVENTSTAASSSTIRFINDATNNTIQNCTIKGSSPTTTVGTIFFSTGIASTGTGNDGNTISGNTITASSSTPANAIYSAGTSSSIDNSGIAITNNNIQDYFSATAASNGILVASFSSAWTITGNKLFQTATRTATSGSIHRGINLISASGVNFNISNNVIGYASAAATGVTTYAGSVANRFIGIELTAGTTTASSLQGNIVTAILLATSANTSAAPGIFTAISILGGRVDVGTTTGNTIGATTGTAAINITSTTTGTYLAGIYSTSTSTVNIQNNTLGAISTGGAANIGYLFSGIDVAGSGVYTITNNTVGNTTADNIAIGTLGITTAFTGVFGISSAATGSPTTIGGTAGTGNTIQNTSSNGANLGTGFLGIRNTATVATVNINYNSFTANRIVGGVATVLSGVYYANIYNNGTVSTALNVNNNTVNSGSISAASFSATAGFFINEQPNNNTTCAVSVQNNTFTGFTYSGVNGGIGGFFYGIYQTKACASLNVSNNAFNNLTLKTAGLVALIFINTNTTTVTCSGNSIGTQLTRSLASDKTFTGIYNAGGGSPYVTSGTHLVSNNSLSNVTSTTTVTTGTSGITGIVWEPGASATSGPTLTVTGNTVTNHTNLGASNVMGILADYSPNLTVSNNTVGNLTGAGAPTTIGISFDLLGLTTKVSKNRIYDISTSSATGVATGINVTASAVANATVNINNNLIGNLFAPSSSGSNQAIGINVIGGLASGNVNIFYNSIYLNAFGGTNFGSSAVSAITIPIVTLRNNVLVNLSAPSGTGLTVAYRRSSTTLTTYGATSNNNLFYAGAPSASNLIFYNGTNSDQTLAAFKTRVSTRDAASVTENPNWQSTVGTNADFLKFNTTTPTTIESGGVNIATYTDDYAGTIRFGNAATTSTGTAPDLGAWELNGVKAVNCSGTPAAAVIVAPGLVCSGTGTSLSLNSGYFDLGITYQWRSSTVSGGPYTTTLGTNATQPSGNLTVTTYFIAEITCASNGLTFTTDEKAIAINALPNVSINPASASYCSLGGTPITLTASGASTYSWSPATGLSATTGASVNVSPAATQVYTVTGTDGNGCVNTATSNITVITTPTGITATATPSTICSGSTSQLTSTYVPGLVNTYDFIGGTTTYNTITGTSIPGAIGNDVGTGNLPIGFTFNYNGGPFTVFGARSNGLIELGQTTESLSGFFQNSLANNANCIAPLWDDNNTTGGTLIYTTTGTAPNRVLTVQWTGMHVGNGSSSQPSINMQVKLYEGTNKIEFIYGATSATLSFTSASIGISGAPGKFVSVTPLNPANTSTKSTTAENAAVTSATNFPSGTIYTFSPTSPYTYSWSLPDNLVSPTSQNTLTTALTASETFTLTVSNGGCSAVASTSVNLSAGSSITTDPVATAKCAGQTATFSVVAAGPGLTYQWRKDMVNIPIGGNASAGTATLSLANVSAADIATYDVVVTSPCGSPVTSAGAALSVTTPLAGIGVSPSTTVCAGTSITLTEIGGNATGWSWAPSGSITQAITVAPAVTTAYTVTATLNGCSATASQTITVNAAPTAVTVTPGTASICAGSSVNLVAGGGSIPAIVTLGAGTSSTVASSPTSTLGPNPLQSRFGGAKQQMIVLASELTGLGLTAGSPLTSIAFNLSALEAKPLQAYTIRMQNTTQGVFTSTAFVSSGFTTVRTAAIITPVIGWNTIPFNTNFTWNGTGNLLIEISYSNTDNGGTGASTAVYSTTGFASSLFYRNDGETPAVVAATTFASFAAYTQRNNMQFGILVPGTYNWSPAGSLNTTVGATVTASPTSNETYTATVTLGGCSASNTATVTVNPNYTIAATAGANGSISPAGITTLSCLGTASQTYTITPDACYTIADVLVDGVSVGAVSNYTYTNVSASHTISATFTKITYPITATAVNGTITPSGTTVVSCGNNQAYTITANSGYTTNDVLVDGVSVGAVTGYVFNNVTTAHTISANFTTTVLPITLTSFTASLQNKKDALLTWKTATETNSKGYEIEMASSSNPTAFAAIGFVAGKGTTTTISNYSFTVPNLAPNTYYSRLKMIDIDGTFTYSSVQSITVVGDKALVSVYPVPVRNQLTVVLSADMQKAGLQLVNSLGQVLLVNTTINGTTRLLNMGGLPTGLYLLKVLDGTNVITTQKVVKE